MDLILKYFPELNATQRQQLEAMHAAYELWNSRINVISRKDMDKFYEHHVLHSLAIARVIRFTAGSRVLDVGTGGGFPGIPLAIMFPDSEFVLVDSIGKKIKVVEEVCRTLEIKNVKAYQARAETVTDKFDFIVSRAVTAFPEFYGWVKNKFSKPQRNALSNGILYLKGGDLQEEFGSFYSRARFFELKDFFEESL